eukprot:1841637-Amphidinium_carterae.1
MFAPMVNIKCIAALWSNKRKRSNSKETEYDAKTLLRHLLVRKPTKQREGAHNQKRPRSGFKSSAMRCAIIAFSSNGVLWGT